MNPDSSKENKKRKEKQTSKVTEELTLEQFYEKLEEDKGFGEKEINKNIKSIKAEQGKLEKAIKPKEKRRIATGVIGGVVSVGLVVGTVASGGLLAVGIAAGCAIVATTGAYAAAARSEINANAKLVKAIGDNNKKLEKYNQIWRDGTSQSAVPTDMLCASYKCYKENCIRDRIQEERKKQTKVIKSRKYSRVGTGALAALAVTGLTVASIATGGAVAVLAAAVGVGVIGTAAYAGAAKREISGYKKLSESIDQHKEELEQVEANIETEIKSFRENHGLDTSLGDGSRKKTGAERYDDPKAKPGLTSKEFREADRADAKNKYSKGSLESESKLPRRASGDCEDDYGYGESQKENPISLDHIRNGHIEIGGEKPESFESLPAPPAEGYGEVPGGFGSESESFESLLSPVDGGYENSEGPEDPDFAGLDLSIFDEAEEVFAAQNSPEEARIIPSRKEHPARDDGANKLATDRQTGSVGKPVTPDKKPGPKPKM